MDDLERGNAKAEATNTDSIIEDEVERGKEVCALLTVSLEIAKRSSSRVISLKAATS